MTRSRTPNSKKSWKRSTSSRSTTDSRRDYDRISERRPRSRRTRSPLNRVTNSKATHRVDSKSPILDRYWSRASPTRSTDKYYGDNSSASRNRFRLRDQRSPHNPAKYNHITRPNRCIGIFGLSKHTSQYKIRDFFERFGYINNIQVIVNPETGRSKGFCFIYYKYINDAREAKDTCNGIELDGRRIRVDYAYDQKSSMKSSGSSEARSGNGYGDRSNVRRQRSTSPAYESKINREHRRDRDKDHDRRINRYRDRTEYNRDNERQRDRESRQTYESFSYSSRRHRHY